ncbi:MAG: cysteine-rich CWC family protein [Pseudomonadota bacterium]
MTLLSKACARCGAPFECGRDEPTCWCVELPPLRPALLDPNQDCWCPRCLRAISAETLPPVGKCDDRANDPRNK